MNIIWRLVLWSLVCTASVTIIGSLMEKQFGITSPRAYFYFGAITGIVGTSLLETAVRGRNHK